MDISYLLALQNLREACGSVVEKIVSALTDIPFNPLTILLICTLYWCIDKRMGFFILFSQSFGTFVNNVIKLCVCAYRPWIRDTRINPPLKAKAGATGYSFPSGHTLSVVGEYGTLGYALIKKDKENKNHKWLWAIIVCAFLILIVAFSRNFLSVHTPQDVLVGLCVGLIIVWLTDIILRVEQRDEENKKNVDLWIVIGGSVLIVLATLLVLLKKYPMDYADGVLIVMQGEDRKKRVEAYKKLHPNEEVPKKVRNGELKLGMTYEGWKEEGKNRYKLIGKEYVAGFMDGEKMAQIMKAKIYSKYDVDQIELNVTNSDGASWIKRLVPNKGIYQADCYHLKEKIIPIKWKI